jgi:hypothetical protein
LQLLLHVGRQDSLLLLLCLGSSQQQVRLVWVLCLGLCLLLLLQQLWLHLRRRSSRLWHQVGLQQQPQ